MSSKPNSPAKTPPKTTSPTRIPPAVVQKGAQNKQTGSKPSAPCPFLCELVPTNVPSAGSAQPVLHPRKDVFVLKVAKIGPNGDRRCKMEVELVTPKFLEKKSSYRVDTRETQCEPDPPPCCCCARPKKIKN